MNKDSKIYVAGHRGLVGSAILKNLQEKGYHNIITRTHNELDLTNQAAVATFFSKEQPEYVFLAAAKVGGIVANNTYRADFIYENMMIQNNVIHQSYVNGVKKLLFLGSTCIYPKNCPQPMKEEYLLTNTLEYTNEPYAIAKIAGIKMCESYNLQYGTNFISVMPTNLYGPNDNFDLEKSHVLPALIRKIHLAKLLYENNWKLIKEDLNKNPISGIDANSSEKEIAIILAKHGIYFSPFGGDAQSAEGAVEIWGSGKPRREFLWSEDMADACVFIMQNRDFNDIVIANEMKQSLEKEQSSNFNDTVIAREVKQSLKTDQNPNIQDVVIANEMKQSHELEQSSNQNSAKKGFQPETRNTHINIGTGTDISIKELAETIKNIIGFKGDLVFNTDKPDGTMRKLTDVSKLNGLGWTHKVELGEGVKRAYKWYIIK